MAEQPSPPRDTTTVARFIEEAASVSGGMEALRRRLGCSRASIERMRVSDEPMLTDDATALLEVFGLSPGGVAEPSDRGRRRGSPGRR
jgi:hypothetical protein